MTAAGRVVAASAARCGGCGLTAYPADEMIAYYAKHTGRMGYFGRLRCGRSIGSGAVDGLARRMDRRLKVPGRGWRIGNVDGMAALVATVDTLEWEGFRSRPAA